jgi:hypothetical protein
MRLGGYIGRDAPQEEITERGPLMIERLPLR